jgi:hypothetical protein
MPGRGLRHSHCESALCGQKKNRIDASADLRKRLVHSFVDRIERRDIEQPAPDARLIGCDDDAITGVVQARDCLETAGDRAPLVRRLDELIAVMVDDAVAIQNDQASRARGGDGFVGELNHALVCGESDSGSELR